MMVRRRFRQRFRQASFKFVVMLKRRFEMMRYEYQDSEKCFSTVSCCSIFLFFVSLLFVVGLSLLPVPSCQFRVASSELRVLSSGFEFQVQFTVHSLLAPPFLIPAFTHSFTPAFFHSRIHSFQHSFIHSRIHSFTHSLTHSRIST